MDPGIDVDVVAVNAAAEAGRGGGLDWTASLTFDTVSLDHRLVSRLFSSEKTISHSVRRDSRTG